MEKGENGTPHIQAMVRTQSVRFSQMKKALPRAHIEVARAPQALAKYVVKEETRVAPLQTTKVATQSDVQKGLLKLTSDLYLTERQEMDKDRFYEWLRNRTLDDYTRKGHFIESMIDTVVKQLILDGYYGVEFVMMNPQVRQSFKKYFCEIIIREYARSQDQPPSQDNSSAPTPQIGATQNPPDSQSDDKE